MKYTSGLISLIVLCFAAHIAIGQKKAAWPHLVIYKTKKDYNNLVPVILSKDRKMIVSYPDPQDLAAAPLPTVLHKGYLLDNRGIGENVAFLKLTYHEYAQLQKVPSPKELLRMIADKDPLITLCDCGNKYSYKDPVSEINELIDRNRLTTTCKLIKQKGKK